jgi:outer membrane protein assembly factor BamB
MKFFYLLLGSAALVDAQNWPSFQGVNASGVSGGKAPLTWDATKGVNVVWKTAIPGLAHSSPVIWGERIYVTTAVSSDPNAVFRHGLYGDVDPSPDVSKHTWRVYCLDKRTGKILWERVAHEGAPKTKRHPKSSQGSSTPATDGKHVVAFFGSEGLYTYDTEGRLLWKQDLGILNAGWFYDPDYEWGVASSPIIHQNLVIVQCDIQKDSFVAAYDIHDGHRVWMTRREEIPSWATPTIYDGPPRTELITHATKFIRAYDPASGKELWRLSGNSEVTSPTPIVAGKLILITNGYRVIQPIYAIRPGGSGDITLKEGQESNDFVAWSKKQGGPYMATPVVYDGLLYTCGMNGVIACYNVKTGERVYQKRLGEGGAFTASPVAADGKVYFTSEDGDVFVVKAGVSYGLLAKNPIGEVCMASPAISDGTVFVRAEHHLFAIADRAN